MVTELVTAAGLFLEALDMNLSKIVTYVGENRLVSIVAQYRGGMWKRKLYLRSPL